MNKSILVFLAATGITASLQAAAPVAVHDYQFNGNLNDSIGAVPLSSNGGSLVSTPGWLDFGVNEGPAFNGVGEGGLAGNYSIAMRFSVATTDGYRKVVDFKNQTDDNGFYVYNDGLYFFSFANAPGLGVQDDTVMSVVLTRDGATDVVNAYLNGNPAPVLTFIDSGGDGKGDSLLGGARFNFFQDDGTTDFEEASDGSVDRIIIFDGPLAPSDVNVFGDSAVPEPSTWSAAFLGTLLAAKTALRRRTA